MASQAWDPFSNGWHRHDTYNKAANLSLRLNPQSASRLRSFKSLHATSK